MGRSPYVTGFCFNIVDFDKQPGLLGIGVIVAFGLYPDIHR